MCKEWGQGENKGKLDSFLTMQSQNKVNPGFSFDPGPRVLTLNYLKLSDKASSQLVGTQVVM